MQIKEITNYIESIAPLSYQESYDNAGLIVGNDSDETNGALITLDVTEPVIDEAIRLKFKMIIAHHPLIFNGIKKINSSTEIGRCLIKAVKNNIAVYAAHTNLDNVKRGVNGKICDKIGLTNCRMLEPFNDKLRKLVVYTPEAYASQVQESIFKAGGGCIGDYDSCGYSLEGKGTFRGNKNTHPFVGEKGELHTEREVRLETIIPEIIKERVISAIKNVHPYEVVAYDLYPLDLNYPLAGSGMTGELPEPEDEDKFLRRIKETFKIKSIRHSSFLGKKIKKVALCGGSGSSLINQAIFSKADIFLTGDIKYHDFFRAENKIILADIGHYESEQYTKELFYDLLIKKFPKFAFRLSDINTNPVNYMI